ncbi:hypothetical protein PcaKH35_36760 [Parageobacillus caldoxylosilyticus]|nr:hypothetical protein PcaKH35_36760 [Parageobacillus caldoxylosilyticus]
MYGGKKRDMTEKKGLSDKNEAQAKKARSFSKEAGIHYTWKNDDTFSAVKRLPTKNDPNSP